MHLSLFLAPCGHHQAAWRHPEAQADAGISFEHYKAMARLAEAAKFDAIFLADNQSVRPGPPEVVGRVSQYVANLEPLTTLGALAAVTERIGLIATASTTYNYPFQLARKLASLDHLSGGRIGWNIVTGALANEAQNFGVEEHYEHDLRYEMADEFVQVCRGLWDSWDDDAFVYDKPRGVFSEPAKLHALNHAGRFFRVRGPLNVPRPPQGYPLHVQAGTSAAGKAFAAKYAEMIFVSPLALAQAQALYTELKTAVRAAGRNPDQVKVMPGLVPIVAPTEAEAKSKVERLNSLLDPVVALHFLGTMKLAGADLSGYDLDGPLPDPLPMQTGVVSPTHVQSLVEKARREQLTIRQLMTSAASSGAGFIVAGTPGQVVDFMEEWATSGACDGFNIQPAYLPGGFQDFVALAVPELQRRGLLRREYAGRTLREHFGLPRPESRYVRQVTAAANR